MGYGLSIQAGPGVDDLVTGVMPGLSTATFDPMGLEPYQGVQIDVDSVPSVGGNMIRYHLSEGYSLDYTVTSTNVKQELRIEERPSVTEGMAWFGLSEMMRLPADYAVFDGETMVGEMLHETQNTLEIRHVETGRLLATIAEPVAYDAAEGEPYQATYFLQVVGTQVVIATMVEVTWLLDEDRVYPVVIDPTIGPSGTTQTHGGYCNRQYANCYGGATYTSRYVVNRGGGVYYTAWHRFNVPTTSTMLPNGTLSDISLKQYTRAYSYYGGIPSSTSANQPAVTVLEDCGNNVHTVYLRMGRQQRQLQRITAVRLDHEQPIQQRQFKGPDPIDVELSRRELHALRFLLDDPDDRDLQQRHILHGPLLRVHSRSRRSPREPDEQRWDDLHRRAHVLDWHERSQQRILCPSLLDHRPLHANGLHGWERRCRS